MHTNPGKVKKMKRKTLSNDGGDGISLEDDIVLSKRKCIKKHNEPKGKMPLESARKSNSSVKHNQPKGKIPLEIDDMGIGTEQYKIVHDMGIGILVDDQIQVKHVDEVDKDNEMNNGSELEVENGIKQGDEDDEDQADEKHVYEAAQERVGCISGEDNMIDAKLSCVLQEFNDCLQRVELVFKELSNKYPTSMECGIQHRRKNSGD
ncbi:hypothetical protein QVD17_16486 [Tagetes erecta]|uniref:Uncharacterized protein n=1 Tax=Tagetes erecta TaxID=13708 RepID=A0AAD8KVA8_TARER|nr:hypothetical protein QVD17_16486 [Tagetes erecta]